MKKLSLAVLFSLASLLSFAQNLNVMSFNIRYNTERDSANAWRHRKDIVASQILFHDAHLVGVQEALYDQMLDMAARLPRFKHIGTGRDGGTKGEHSAIFYDTTRLRLLDSQTFWLSTTPNVVASKGWDAALTRVVTWAKFKDRRSGKTFFHFNTHFDHMGKEARRESARLLLQKVESLAGKTPSVVTGDFNAAPDDEPIRVVVDAANPLRLTDTKDLSATPHYGPTGTFNGFGPKERDDKPIDYIFVKGTGWKVAKHATLSQSWNGRFASDHFALLSVLAL